MGKLVAHVHGAAITASVVASGLQATRPLELVRQFIDDCLYNPRTGYFNRIVNIFDGGKEPIRFQELKDQEDYTRRLHQMYREQSREDDEYYQLWHTPSELFKPWYGQAIANYMVARHLQDLKKSAEPLVVYEVGPGNGSLAKSILDYLQSEHEDLYSKMIYNLVEISPILSSIQQSKLYSHSRAVKFHQCSALDLPVQESRPAFVLAMEVLDNMPHDRITYDENGDLQQGIVITNDEATSLSSSPGRYSEHFEPVVDPLIIEYMNLRDDLQHTSPSLKWHPLSLLDPIMASRNPWTTEFIPTVAYSFLKSVCQRIPNHRLIISDFSTLPDAIRGYSGPVVQTRYKGDTVACSSYLLQRGLFDIFFPTSFGLLKNVHRRLSGGTPGQIMSHADFCKKFADTSSTRTRSGYNPMIEEFQNVHMYLS